MKDLPQSLQVRREGKKDAAAVRSRRVADGNGPGLALGDRMVAAAGRAGGVQGSGVRDKKFREVVMSDSFENMNFRGQASTAMEPQSQKKRDTGEKDRNGQRVRIE